jgi:hypothetical protein
MMPTPESSETWMPPLLLLGDPLLLGEPLLLGDPLLEGLPPLLEPPSGLPLDPPAAHAAANQRQPTQGSERRTNPYRMARIIPERSPSSRLSRGARGPAWVRSIASPRAFGPVSPSRPRGSPFW